MKSSKELLRNASMLAGVALLTVSACDFDSAPASHSEQPTRTGQPLAEQSRDSAWAAHLAREVFLARFPSPGDTLRVSAFEEDGDGYLITLEPMSPTIGGAGTVRVKMDGTAKIVEVQQ